MGTHLTWRRIHTEEMSMHALRLGIRLPMLLGAMALATGIAAQEPIKLGIVLPLSGNNGQYVRQYMVSAIEMAVKETNDKGGVLGRQVQLVAEDSRYEPAGAVSAFRKLVDVDHVMAVFTGFTPLTLPQIPVAEEKKVILIAPATEHPDFTRSRWTLRMTPTSDKSGTKAAQLAQGLGMKTAVIVAEDNESIRLTVRAFEAEFERSGGKVLGSETFKASDNDVRGQLTKLRAARADTMWVATSTGRPMAMVIKQMGEVGLRVKQVITNHLIEDKEVRSAGLPMIEGIVYTTLKLDPAFSPRFKAIYGYEPDSNVGKHYDATMILMEAIRRARSADPELVRDALYAFGDYAGVLGTFRFNGSGEPGILPAARTIKGGQFVDYVQ